MKHVSGYAIGILAAICGAQCTARAQSIVRVKDVDPHALILTGVRIPSTAEIFLLSGTVALPVDPAKAETVDDYGNTERQTISTLSRIRATLESQGYSMHDLVKLTVYLAGDPKLGGKLDFAGMNAGFAKVFGTAQNPETVARSTVQVAALTSPKYLIEIDAIAAR